MLDGVLRLAAQRGNESRRAKGRALDMTRVPSLFLLSIVLCFPGCDPVGGDDRIYRMGELIWSRDLANPSIIDITKPVIDGEVIYAAAGGELLSLTLTDGAVRWKRPLSGFHFSQNMVHDAEAIYVVHRETIEAYNKHDGSLRWQANDLFVPSLSVLTGTETHIYASETAGKVGRIRKLDGTVDQEILLTDLKPEGTQQNPGILMHTDDNYLYVPTSYYVPGAPNIGGNVLAYDATTGDFLWGYEVPTREVPIPGYPGQYFTMDVGADEGFVWRSYVIIQATSMVIALDRFSGELRWQQLFEDQAGFWLGMALANDVVYVGATDGIVYALDPATGEILWEGEEPGGGVITLLEVANGRIYFETTTGRLAVLDASTGHVLWSGLPPDYESSGGYAEFISPVAAYGGYMVNVGSYTLYCLADR